MQQKNQKNINKQQQQQEPKPLKFKYGYSQILNKKLNIYEYNKLTKQEIEEQQQLKKLQKQQKIKPQITLQTCEICYGDFEELEKLENCDHQFCKKCIKTFIEHNLKKKKSVETSICCPEESCLKPISLLQFLELFKFSQLIDSFLNYSTYLGLQNPDFQQFKVMICYQKKCNKIFAYHKNQKKELFCKKCMISYDPVTQMQNTQFTQEQIEEMVDFRILGFMRCPACMYWVEKNEGCNHMECKCSYNFCYDCGGNIFYHNFCGINPDPIQYKVINLAKKKIMQLDDTDKIKINFLQKEENQKLQLEYLKNQKQYYKEIMQQRLERVQNKDILKI